MPSTTLISGDTTIEKIERSLLYMLLEFHIFIYKKFIANYNSIHQKCYNVVKEAFSEKEGTWQRNHISLEFGVPLVYFACKSNNSSIYLKNTVYLVLALCRFTVIWLHPQIISSLLAIMTSRHCPQTLWPCSVWPGCLEVQDSGSHQRATGSQTKHISSLFFHCNILSQEYKSQADI